MSSAVLSPVEQALVDLARAGIQGDSDGVRVLARRATRRLPEGLAHPALFKEALIEALALPGPAESSPLRSATQPSAVNADVWLQSESKPTAPVLPLSVDRQVESLLAEHSDAEGLHRFGLYPSRTVLFTGAPGVGKTLTASYVATRLNAPLVTVNFASMISSLLGQTGSNLQAVVDSALESNAVLFLDEFDAIAKSRGDQQDLGEMKRVVNVVLQQLDRWPAGRLLIAATNHPELLDNAIFRRFDASVAFTLPGAGERRRFLQQHDVLNRMDVSDAAREALVVISHDDTLSALDIWVKAATRRIILARQTGDASNEILTLAMGDARVEAAASPEARAALARVAKQMGWTQRKTADWLGVSHVTVGNDLRSR